MTRLPLVKMILSSGTNHAELFFIPSCVIWAFVSRIYLCFVSSRSTVPLSGTKATDAFAFGKLLFVHYCCVYNCLQYRRAWVTLPLAMYALYRPIGHIVICFNYIFDRVRQLIKEVYTCHILYIINRPHVCHDRSTTCLISINETYSSPRVFFFP